MAKDRLLLVDGYNVLNAWPELMRARTLEEARAELVHRLNDYAGYSGQKVIVVFDAWKQERLGRTKEEMGPLSVVYTQKGETADHYIERLCDERAHRVAMGWLEVRVATSDGVEQTVVMGRGATRLSARELIYEMRQVRESGRSVQPDKPSARSTVMDRVPEEVRRRLESMRRGERDA